MENKFRFCYIDDATKSIFKILNKKRVYGQIFNIGYGKEFRRVFDK